MNVELTALHRNKTRELVPRHPSQNIVGCKWVFRVKRHSNGSIDSYKSRIVAKGFHQRPGVDYHETFSLVIKPTIIRVVLTIALSHGWPINQLNVNNGLLHGSLTEEVFMSQPPGFGDKTKPYHVCRLRRFLYGLKQAPHVWFQELKGFLLSLKFLDSKSDSSLFVYSVVSLTIYFLVYVDDLLITGSSQSFVQHVIHALASRFSIKDLVHLHYFLGVKVLPTPQGMFLSH